jgi:hypothetical protein
LTSWGTRQINDDEVRYLGLLLTKILGDDLVVNDQGQAQIGQGTATDRIISVTDPEMRHGHKSQAHLFNGFKASVSTDQHSEMILDIADVTASGSDGAHLLPIIKRVEEQADVTVDRVIGDGAYGSGENRAAGDTYPSHAVDLLSPLARLSDSEVDKSAFQIDLDAQMATCPQGHTVTGQPGGKQDGQDTWLFTFPRATCEACPLFERCVHSKKTGRTVCSRTYEAYVQAARLRLQTEEFDTLY